MEEFKGLKRNAENYGIYMGIGDIFFLEIFYREELELLMKAGCEKIMANEGNDIRRIATYNVYRRFLNRFMTPNHKDMIRQERSLNLSYDDFMKGLRYKERFKQSYIKSSSETITKSPIAIIEL